MREPSSTQRLLAPARLLMAGVGRRALLSFCPDPTDLRVPIRTFTALMGLMLCAVACANGSAASRGAQPSASSSDWRTTARHVIGVADGLIAPEAPQRVTLARQLARLQAWERAEAVALAIAPVALRIRALLEVGHIARHRGAAVRAKMLQQRAFRLLLEHPLPAAMHQRLYLSALEGFTLADFRGEWGPGDSGYPALQAHRDAARRRFASVMAGRGLQARAEALVPPSPGAARWLSLARAAAAGGHRDLAGRWLSKAIGQPLTLQQLSLSGTLARRVADDPTTRALVARYLAESAKAPDRSAYSALDIALLAHKLGQQAPAQQIAEQAFRETIAGPLALRRRRLPYLAYVYAQLDRPQSATRALERALADAGSAEPARRETVLRVAKGFVELGDVDRARELARHYDTTASAEVFMALGDHHLRRGETVLAVDALAEVANVIPEPPKPRHLPVLLQLGLRYYRASDREAALWALDTYVDAIGALPRSRRGPRWVALVEIILQTRLSPSIEGIHPGPG